MEEGRWFEFSNRVILTATLFSVSLSGREEREWREWVDSKLVVAVVPNMFRTLHQSLRCFDYTREVTTFNPLERLAVKYIGGVVMFCIGKYMKRK